MRIQQRAELAKLGEIAVMRILGRVPRNARRHAGRVLGNAARRYMLGLPAVPADVKANPAVVAWMVREWEALKAQVEAKDATVPEVSGN